MAKKVIYFPKPEKKQVIVENTQLLFKLRDLNPYNYKIDWESYRQKWHELIMPFQSAFKPINYSYDSKRNQVELSNEIMVITIKKGIL